MAIKALSDIRLKIKILKHAEQSSAISHACRYYGISRETLYRWKKACAAKSEAGPINGKPCPENSAIRVPGPIEEKILYLRKTCHLGQQRISWYLARYHQIKVSAGGGAKGVLLRRGLNRLPKNEKKRFSPQFKRHEKQALGCCI